MAKDTNKTEKRPPLPKRLLLLLILIALPTIIGFQFQQGILIAILLLLIILASIGRQKAGLIMLRLYSAIVLLTLSCLPILHFQGTNIGAFLPNMPLLSGHSPLFYLLLWIGSSIIAILQVYLAFSQKVSAYFKQQINLNIIN
ncbi:hypothetical protein [uncultured Shewanella sp.]|uniref:hypothetical protein n=1 Tax=uncultured Shewanella sp. TaxID=173975 RepID=UPI002605B5DF|nr:hypothetical protein [uncultured Shewanella sp.]